MTFEEILNQAGEMLRRNGRVSMRSLIRNFNLDEAAAEDLKFELTEVKRIAVTDEKSILTWIGEPGELNPSMPQDQNGSKIADGIHRHEDKAERRQLTVMFIDLVGSTLLSHTLDPEDLRDVLYIYQELFDSIVKKHRGLVVQHQGDGIVAYFGYPIAQEDDPRRAVQAGLEMIHSLQNLNQQLQREKNVTIQVRIGVHTGLVVVGTAGGSSDSLMHAIGEGPNLASRIQNEASPDTLLISDVTNKLVSGYFETKNLGGFTLKGFAQPVDLFLVLGEKESNPLELMSDNNLTPLIGRDAERIKILELWNAVQQSHGQFVLIGGEAGIGKTRFIYSIARELMQGNKTPHIFRCSAYHRNTSFQPVIERLHHEAGISPEAKSKDNLEKLELYLKKTGIHDSQDIVLFADLLSLPLQGRHKELNMPAEKRKVLTLSALVRWMLHTDKASLIVFEDIQWADPSTLEMIGQVLDKISHSQVLLIASCRPEFQPPWQYSSHMLQLTLNRLTHLQTEMMIRTLAKNLPAVVVQDLLMKTDGNPLFIEEVTKFVLESGVLEHNKDGYQLKGSLKSLSIPNTLQDSLMARLDRLGPAKIVAQIGATIGREFSYTLVRAISQLSDDALQHHLHKLVDTQMLYCKGKIPDAEYSFKHALVQETAYMSLLKKRRQDFHRKIVETLEISQDSIVQSSPELLAYHCTEAGLLEKALPYWKHAGELAVAKSAHAEAISHLNEGLRVLQQLPDSEQKIQDEILIQIALGVPLTALRGYGSHEVEEAYNRARLLCQQAGETSQLVPALYGLWRYYLLRAEYKEALALSERILGLATHSADPLHLVVAHRACGATNYYLGKLDTAWHHLEKIVVSKVAPENRTGTHLYDVADAWITSRSYASWTLWLQGYPDQAVEQSIAAIEAAEQIKHPFSIALTKSFAAWLYQYRGESDKVKEYGGKGLVVSEENSFAFWVGWDRILICWANDFESNKEDLYPMQEGLDIWYATGSKLGSSYFLFLLAERFLAHKDIPQARKALERAKDFIEKTGENWWLSEINRLEGNLCLAEDPSNITKAEQCFRKALKIAAAQKAKSLELRAVTDLGILLQKQKGQPEARLLLSQIIDWFKEGLDLPDMKKAKTVLELLSNE